MELVYTVMLNVIVLMFFAAILDLLLPDGSFRSYIKMAMGFFAVLTMLQPMLQILQEDTLENMEQHVVQAGQIVLADVNDDDLQGQMQDYQKQYTVQIEDRYAVHTAQQIKSLLLLSDYTVNDVQCIFEPEQDSAANRKLKVLIQLQGNETDSRQIQTAISGYFGLEESQVRVQWNNEEVQSHDGITK